MDGHPNRNWARAIVIGFLVAVVLLFTCGVIWKINHEFIHPMESVPVSETKN